MLYSEKMKATDKGGCRPSFKKRKEYQTWTGSKRTSASAALLQRRHTAPGRRASDCLKCGKCEKVCPQHLPIRKLLEDVAKEFEKA